MYVQHITMTHQLSNYLGSRIDHTHVLLVLLLVVVLWLCLLVCMLLWSSLLKHYDGRRSTPESISEHRQLWYYLIQCCNTWCTELYGMITVYQHVLTFETKHSQFYHANMCIHAMHMLIYTSNLYVHTLYMHIANDLDISIISLSLYIYIYVNTTYMYITYSYIWHISYIHTCR